MTVLLIRRLTIRSLGDVHPAGKPLIPVVYDHKADKYIGESTDIIKYIEVQLLCCGLVTLLASA